jgi:hypothetical protein
VSVNKVGEGSISRWDIKYYLNSLIVVLLVFGVPHLPAVNPITPYGMQIIGIFLGMLYGWSTVGIVWPSLLGLVALGFTKYTDFSVVNAFKEGYGGDTYLFIFFVLTFAAVIDRSGVTNVIAKWMVSRKIAKGRPYVLLLLLLTAAFLLAVFVSVMPSIVICWSLLYQFCEVFGYTKDDKYAKLAVIGVLVAACMGVNVFPFKAYCVMMTGVLTKATGMQVNYLTFTALTLIIGYAVTLFYILMTKYVFKPDVSLIEQSSFVYSDTDKLTSYHKQVMALLVAMVILMFLPGFLSPNLYFIQLLKKIGNTGIFVMLIAFGVFLKRKDGSAFINYTECVKFGVPWETMALMATAMPLASALTATGTGVQEWLNQILGPIIGGNGALLLIVFIIGITIIASNAMNHVVVGFVMMPLIIQFSAPAGLDPMMLTAAICIVSQIAFILPSGGPLAAFLHANREWLTASDIYKVTIPFVLASTVLSIILVATIGRLIF